ncbi:MAG: hypothetical protein KY439_01510 [Actinobacteria bacterium]|nr:hypothetical protein [Actinomycetota bacterium]
MRDLAIAGRDVVLVWAKRLWRCPDADCEVGTWSERCDDIAPRGRYVFSAPEHLRHSRLRPLTTQSGRWRESCTAATGRPSRAPGPWSRGDRRRRGWPAAPARPRPPRRGRSGRTGRPGRRR